MKKHREWWVDQTNWDFSSIDNYYEAAYTQPVFDSLLHVIEYKAYAEQVAENEQLKREIRALRIAHNTIARASAGVHYEEARAVSLQVLEVLDKSVATNPSDSECAGPR